jgi:hypothetical protein
VNTQVNNEAIGKLLRHRDVDVKRLSFVNAELSQAAVALKTASSQLTALLDRHPSEAHSALSRVDINHILKLLGEREHLCRKIAAADGELRRMNAQNSP